jgi:electron transfer flavoprotein beta subunit
MKFKKARTTLEIEQEVTSSSTAGQYGPDLLEEEIQQQIEFFRERGLLIKAWSAKDIKADPGSIGLAGSPTKVKKVQSVVLTASENKRIEPTPDGIQTLFKELIEDRTFG